MWRRYVVEINTETYIVLVDEDTVLTWYAPGGVVANQRTLFYDENSEKIRKYFEEDDNTIPLQIIEEG